MSEMTIIESLQRAIHAGENAGAVTTEIQISDAAAWQLAGELAQIQMVPAATQAGLYRGMKDGTSRLMGRAIVVADA